MDMLLKAEAASLAKSISTLDSDVPCKVVNEFKVKIHVSVGELRSEHEQVCRLSRYMNETLTYLPALLCALNQRPQCWLSGPAPLPPRMTPSSFLAPSSDARSP